MALGLSQDVFVRKAIHMTQRRVDQSPYRHEAGARLEF
jgi:hypothetical protein